MRLSIRMRDDEATLKNLIYILTPFKCAILMILCLILFSSGLAEIREKNKRKTAASPKDEGKQNYALIVENHNWQSLYDSISSSVGTGKTLSSLIKMALEQFGYKEEHIIYHENGQASYEKLVATLSRLTNELKPRDNLFIYFLGECHFDSFLEKSYFFTSDFYSNKQTRQIHHSVFPDIARMSPYKLDARDFGKWLEKLTVHETYIVLNTSNSFSFFSQVKKYLTNLPANRAVHFLVLNNEGSTEKEESDAIGNFHKCFISVLRNAGLREEAEIPVTRINDAFGECIGPAFSNTIITESCRSMSYKGKGFVFAKMMGTLEASLRVDFKNIIKQINEKRSARELLKEDRADYLKKFFRLKNRVKKHLKTEVFCRKIDEQVFQLRKEIKEIERIEKEFEMIGCLPEKKRPMRYKKLYFFVTEISKKREFASKGLSKMETNIKDELIEIFAIEYERLIVKLDNPKLHCLTKHKACKYFLSLFQDLKFNDVKVAEIEKRSRQYKCSFIEIVPSSRISLISNNGNINLRGSDLGHMNIRVAHDLNSRVLLFKFPLILTPSISYYRHLSEDKKGVIKILNNRELYFDARKYHSWEIGIDLKWGASVDDYGLYVYLGGGYRRSYFSIKYMENLENHEAVDFRELENKKSFGCFTITTGILMKFHFFAIIFGFPIFNGKSDSGYNYEVQDGSNSISLKPLHFSTKRNFWVGLAIYF